MDVLAATRESKSVDRDTYTSDLVYLPNCSWTHAPKRYPSSHKRCTRSHIAPVVVDKVLGRSLGCSFCIAVTSCFGVSLPSASFSRRRRHVVTYRRQSFNTKSHFFASLREQLSQHLPGEQEIASGETSSPNAAAR